MERKVRAIMKATGWTQQQVAEAFGVGQSTVNRWLKGSEPEGHRRDQINEKYDELVSDGPALVDGETEIPVVGFLGAGAEIEPEFEQVPPEGLYQVSIPFPVPDEMMAFEVRGDSMLPVYKNGHIIVVFKEQQRPLHAFYGEDAAVKTSDGRRFIKTIQRGVDGGVNLFSFNAPLIENVRLEWIGEIFAVLPRTQIKTMAKKGGLQGQLNFKRA